MMNASFRIHKQSSLPVDKYLLLKTLALRSQVPRRLCTNHCDPVPCAQVSRFYSKLFHHNCVPSCKCEVSKAVGKVFIIFANGGSLVRSPHEVGAGVGCYV